MVRWVLPAVAAIALAIRMAFVNPDATLLNVLGWAVTAGIAVLAILLNRVGKAWVGRPVTVISVVVTVLLVVQAVVWPRPYNQDEPSLYFSGKIRVGVSGDIPGWNSFDARLIGWIMEHYGVEDWESIRLFQNQRDKALQNGRVDIVVSSYTANTLRAKSVDFAGPYYLDTAGVWGNAGKIREGAWFSPDAEKHNPTVCGVLGTTGNSSMASFLATQDPKAGGAIMATGVYQNTADCLRDMFDPNSEVVYAATDWSTLKAYNPDAEVVDANRTHPHIDRSTGALVGTDPGLAGWDSVDKPQYYGVAIRDGHPVTCRDLTTVVQEFVDQTSSLDRGYSEAYAQSIGPRLGPVATDWHRPNFDALNWGGSGSPICE
ncbi:transporter substrate-binding domain-containing protein [Paractinoplanes rishiriensis]|nr:transporter substrate-binding domain-containing protein [Actinoplanes rishiriensis]